MNFEQAQQALSEGKKVKLSDWMGYWFIHNGQIKVFTRTGDILDTPHIERYKDRDDWEITDGAMGFEFAILALKSGKRVARSGWNGKGMFIYMVEGSTVAFENLRGAAKQAAVKATEIEKGEQGSARWICPHIDMKAADGTLVIGWLASQTDMLAEDWQIV